MAGNTVSTANIGNTESSIVRVDAKPVERAHEAHELSPVQQFEWAVERLEALANMLAHTGSFGTRDPAIILAKLVAARDLGITPISGLAMFHYVDGSLVPHYKLLGALIKRHPRYDYIVTDWTPSTITLWILVDGEPIRHPATGEPISITVTLEECVRAGFTNDARGKMKPAWAQHSRLMLLGQALKQAVAAYFPDVLVEPSLAASIQVDVSDVIVEEEGGESEEERLQKRIIEAARAIAERNGVEVSDVLVRASEELGAEVDAEELLQYLRRLSDGE